MFEKVKRLLHGPLKLDHEYVYFQTNYIFPDSMIVEEHLLEEVSVTNSDDDKKDKVNLPSKAIKYKYKEK